MGDLGQEVDQIGEIATRLLVVELQQINLRLVVPVQKLELVTVSVGVAFDRTLEGRVRRYRSRWTGGGDRWGGVWGGGRVVTERGIMWRNDEVGSWIE